MNDPILFTLIHYTKSLHKHRDRDIINAGTSPTNAKRIPLSRAYTNPTFLPRRFDRWPDTFSVVFSAVDNSIEVRRTDDPRLGWGETLLIDVEFELPPTAAAAPPKALAIPRVIYQTFATHSVPRGMYEAVDSWRALNPEYEHYFFDDAQCVDFIDYYFDADVLDAFLTLIPGAFKADLWRCCVLYEHGGVYVDADTICLEPLDDFLDPEDEFVVARDDPMSTSYLYNAFIACVPKHPFLAKQIDAIVANVKARRTPFYLDISGPGLLGKSVNECCARESDSAFGLGPQEFNGHRLRILRHDWPTHTIELDGRPILVTEYPGKPAEMESTNAPTFYSLYQSNVVYQAIPREIFYTSHDHLGINGYMVESFAAKNPHWTLTYSSDRDRGAFLEEHRQDLRDLLGLDVLPFYRTLSRSDERANFWRYCVLFLRGGIYVGADTYCATPLDDWVLGHDLVLGVDGNPPRRDGSSSRADAAAHVFAGGKPVRMCTWAFGAAPRHDFFKNMIVDICAHPSPDARSVEAGPGRLTQHAVEYFTGADFSRLDTEDVTLGASVLFSQNKFGSNPTHTHFNLDRDAPLARERDDVYIVHFFEGTQRRKNNRPIRIYESSLGLSHNLAIKRDGDGFFGVARLDVDASRTRFMETIGDCRSLLELRFNGELEITSEREVAITNYDRVAKFEDYRIVRYKGRDWFPVSYIDQEFNTRVALLGDDYSYRGDVNIDGGLKSLSFTGRERIWEKNWLFLEKGSELFLIYSTMPRYIVYRCRDFERLAFEKIIDIDWPLRESIPAAESYFTPHVAAGGSSHPIFLADKKLYLYFVHTKLYAERKYNHYAVVLDQDLLPVAFCRRPIIHKYASQSLCFVSSVVETEDYLVFSGGVDDARNFIWELSKEAVYETIGL